MEHTKEPWEAFPSEDCHAIAWVGKIGIFQADGMPHREWADPEIDARRIVACVNACERINTDYLETLVRESSSIDIEMTQRIQNKNAADNARKKAEQQRDEFRAALNDANDRLAAILKQSSVEELRSIEVPYLDNLLAESIAKLGYPVGCGVPPNPEATRRAAEALFDRFVQLAALFWNSKTTVQATASYPYGSLGEQVESEGGAA